MCGIMFCSDTSVKMEDFELGFQKIQYRGPDMSRIVKTKEGYFGFHRLAIMDLDERGMQPFERDENIAICNGELYNYQKLKAFLQQFYVFHSESDCELLLPLYLEYGTKMFQMLDAEFACVLYDAKRRSLIAARDPFGIRGLFYGYHKTSKKIMFASEAKCLVGLCSDIFPFPPGHYYQDGAFISYCDIAQVTQELDKGETIFHQISEKLTAGVLKRMNADAPIGYLLSGGLDSSLVCAIAAKHSEQPIHTFAVGMENDAIDLKYAKEVAAHIGSIHTEVIITKKQIIDILPRIVQICETWDITTIRASIGMYLLCAWIQEHTTIKVLFSGEISDELFGYKYTDFAPNDVEFQKEAQKRVRELYMYDVLRADRCISSNGLEARVPFGDLEFAKYVMSILPKRKMNVYGMGKYLLRKAFDQSLLPDHILYRDKAAFSDAVGHSMVDYIKEYVERYYDDKTFEKRCATYAYCAPFTKESLYYRELFEQHYAGHASLIQAYWMPNCSWKGCNVKDPSARVLSNYGNSGK